MVCGCLFLRAIQLKGTFSYMPLSKARGLPLVKATSARRKATPASYYAAHDPAAGSSAQERAQEARQQ